MRFRLITAALLCALTISAYAVIQQDVVERDTIGGGGGGGGDLSATDIDTFSELDAIVGDAVLVDEDNSQTFLNKIIDGNSNTVKILRHATDCTSFTGAVDGQYCWEEDANLLYVCETADVCDNAGEWDAVASGNPLTVEEADASPTVSNVSKIQFNQADGFSVTDETGGQVQVDLTLGDAQIPNNITVDLATAATALAANGANCSAGNYPLGVDASGAVESCMADDDVPEAGDYTNLSTGLGLQNSPTGTIGFDYSKTLAGNPALGAKECILTSEAGAGGLLCEGTTANTNEFEILVPLVDPADTTNYFALGDSSGNALTANALTSNPADCAANQFANVIAANGNLSCAAIADADVPNNITIDLAATATNLAANPTDCTTAGQFATAIGANGNLTCSKPDGTLVTFRPQEYAPPTSNFATIDSRNTTPILNFNTTTSWCAVWTKVMPRNYAGNGVTMTIYTVAPTLTTGTVQWDVYFEAIGTAQDLDADGFAAAQSTAATSVSATSGIPIAQTVSFTNGAQMDSVAAGDPFRLKICRNVAGDSLAEDASFVIGELKEP